MKADIKKYCAEVKNYGFASVCINPLWVKTASQFLFSPNKDGYYPAVRTAIGFPLGANISDVMANETRYAVRGGAYKIDMVIDSGATRLGCFARRSIATQLVCERSEKPLHKR